MKPELEPAHVYLTAGEVRPAGEFSLEVSLALAVLALLVAVGIILPPLCAAWRARVRATVRDRWQLGAKSIDFDGTLVEGVVLQGNGPGGAVLRVEIEQHGTQEWHSEHRCWLYRWAERARRVRVEPFDLRLDSGAMVRVLASDDVLFECDLAGVVRSGATTRLRVAELRPGARAYVFGALRGPGGPGAYPYRQEGAQRVERPQRGRMLIATHRPAEPPWHEAAPLIEDGVGTLHSSYWSPEGSTSISRRT